MKRQTRGMALMAWMVLCGVGGLRAGDATTPGMDEASAKVSADKPDDTATWKRTTQEQTGFNRKLIVNIAGGYVLAADPGPPAADPGSLWIYDPEDGGVNTSKVVYHGYQNPLRNQKQYTPKFYGKARKEHGGVALSEIFSTDKSETVFDWSVSGKYTVAKCTMENGPVEYERQFELKEHMKATAFDDSLPGLSLPIRIPVALGNIRDLDVAKEKIAEIVTAVEAQVANSNTPVYGFFTYYAPIKSITSGETIDSIAKEKCPSCGGVVKIWEFFTDFDPGLHEYAQMYIPIWEDEPQYESAEYRPLIVQQIVDQFSSTKSHEEQHQKYYMENRNAVIKEGKRLASTKYRVAACEKTGIRYLDAYLIAQDYSMPVKKKFTDMVLSLHDEEEAKHKKLDADDKYCRAIKLTEGRSPQ